MRRFRNRAGRQPFIHNIGMRWTILEHAKRNVDMRMQRGAYFSVGISNGVEKKRGVEHGGMVSSSSRTSIFPDGGMTVSINNTMNSWLPAADIQDRICFLAVMGDACKHCPTPAFVGFWLGDGASKGRQLPHGIRELSATLVRTNPHQT